MAIAKDVCADKVENVRSVGLDIALGIMEATKQPSNDIQIEALKIALEMYKTFSVKA